MEQAKVLEKLGPEARLVFFGSCDQGEEIQVGKDQ